MLTTVPVDGGQGVAPKAKLIADELESVVCAVCAKYPQRPQSEVEAVVLQSYRYLAERATVQAHLIPLTLNRSLRIMCASTQGAGSRSGGDSHGWPVDLQAV